jgi:NhaP-type Na+/H+ or K+/H+ antiporter
MTIAPLTLLAGAFLAYALVSRRLERSIITVPIFFVAIGIVAGPLLFGDVPRGQVVVPVLEATLVMVLFADASALDIRRWTGEPSLSGRLLGLGLPMTMLLGAIVALILFPGMSPWQAGLIGVILAPTDAALGQAVVANPRVPAVVSNAINVESGLNDGLTLPFVTILIAVGEIATGADTETTALETLGFVLIGSTLIGLAAGVIGGWLIRTTADRGYSDQRYQGIALVALAILTFSLADEIETSGFLAVWIAGLTAGALVREHLSTEAFHLSEHLADALAAVAFTLLGAAIIGPVLARATPTTVLYAVLSLTIVRLVPVAIAMVRSGFARPTVAYIGWFGPRGLASIVFASVLVETVLPGGLVVTDIVVLTVAMSIVAHGVTAAWGARKYVTWFERAVVETPDMPEAAELPQGGVQARVPRRVR